MRVSLTFIGTHVATRNVLAVRTWSTSLIGGEQTACTVGTASWVTGIDCWASRPESHRLCGSAIVLQESQHGVGAVQITSVMEVAGVIAAQVVSQGHNACATICSRVVRNNSVLEPRGRAQRGMASAYPIPGNGAVADLPDTQSAPAVPIPTDSAVVDNATAVDSASKVGPRRVPADRAVVDRQRIAAFDPTAR